MKYCITAVGCNLTYCAALICGSLCCYLSFFVLLFSSEPHLPLSSSSSPPSLSHFFLLSLAVAAPLCLHYTLLLFWTLFVSAVFSQSVSVGPLTMVRFLLHSSFQFSASSQIKQIDVCVFFTTSFLIFCSRQEELVTLKVLLHVLQK